MCVCVCVCVSVCLCCVSAFNRYPPQAHLSVWRKWLHCWCRWDCLTRPLTSLSDSPPLCLPSLRPLLQGRRMHDTLVVNVVIVHPKKSVNKRLTSGCILRLHPPTHWTQFALRSSACICVCLRLHVCSCKLSTQDIRAILHSSCKITHGVCVG